MALGDGDDGWAEGLFASLSPQESILVVPRSALSIFIAVVATV